MADVVIQAAAPINKTYFEEVGLRIKVSSQLNLFNLLKDPDSTKYVNIFRNYGINEDVQDNNMLYYNHECSHDEWWEYISNSYYGDVNLWWVIATMNDVVNPFEELDVGDFVKVLNERLIFQLLEDVEEISNL